MLDRQNFSKNYKQRGSHYKFALIVHLILTVKYRRDILKHFGSQLIDKIHDISKSSNFVIKQAQHDNNHIHLMIDFSPKISISQICRKIKSETTNWAWTHHRNICNKYFWKQNKKMLWTDGYFVCTVGDASRDKINEYIANQGK
jgi:putative transposase